MKRNGGIFAFLTIFLSSLASAGPVEGLEQLADGAREMITIVIQFISDVLFDLESFDELFFAKIIIFLIVFFVVYTVLKRNDIFGRDKKITIIITSAISILAIRYLPTTFVEVILLQYGAFAVAITTIIPFMILFFFLHQSGFGHRGRQVGWLIYGAALIGITGFRYNDLGSASYIYYATVAAVIVSILADGMIHAQFLHEERKEMKKQRGLLRQMEYIKKAKVIEDGLPSLTGTERKRAQKVLRHIEERIKDLQKGRD